MFANLKKKLNVDGGSPEGKSLPQGGSPDSRLLPPISGPRIKQDELFVDDGKAETTSGVPEPSETGQLRQLSRQNGSKLEGREPDDVVHSELSVPAGVAVPSMLVLLADGSETPPSDKSELLGAARLHERERLVELLNKRNEQLRAAEGRASEYADIIKEKTHSITQLEKALETQQDGAASRLRELREEHELRTKKLQLTHGAALLQTDTSCREQLDNAEKQCNESKALAEERGHELVRIGQALLLSQEEVAAKSGELDAARARLADTTLTLSECDAALLSLGDRINMLQAERQSLLDAAEIATTEQCSLKEKVRHLQTEASSLEIELVKRHEHIGSLEKLTGELQTIRNKLERDVLDLRNGSSGGLHGAEFSSDAEAGTAVRIKIADMEEIIRQAEKRERTLANLLQEKDTALEAMEKKLKTATAQWDSQSSKITSEYQLKVSHMADELQACRKTFEHEKLALLGRIAKLEVAHDENLERQIEAERRLSESEDELAAVRRSLAEREETVRKLQASTNSAFDVQARLAGEINRLQGDVSNKDKEIEALQAKSTERQSFLNKLEQEHIASQALSSALTAELETCQAVHAKLVVGHSAEHAGQLEAKGAEHAGQLEAKDAELKRLVDELQLLRTAVHVSEAAAVDAHAELERHVGELSKAHSAARLAEEREAELKAVRGSLLDAEERLAEQGKALKLQQQRVNDLKKALQKNLKATAGTVTGAAAPTGVSPADQPTVDQKALGIASVDAAARDSQAGSSDESSGPGSVGHSALQRGTGVGSHDEGNSPLLDRESARHGGMVASPYALSEKAAAVQSVRSDLDGQHRGRRHGSDASVTGTDVNLKYMRHVVLKFMVCREAEAVHLVRAISVLLQLSPQEEKLLKDTLEYRMSWFGPKPQLKTP